MALRSDPLGTLKRGLLLFWSLWFSLALASNVFDALRAMGVMRQVWPFASGNYRLIGKVKSRFATPPWTGQVMFGGVILWEALATLLFWRAASAYRGGKRDQLRSADAAFAGSIGLWCAFLVADELFVAYEMGVEGSHFRLFTAELASLLSIHLLPEQPT